MNSFHFDTTSPYQNKSVRLRLDCVLNSIPKQTSTCSMSIPSPNYSQNLCTKYNHCFHSKDNHLSFLISSFLCSPSSLLPSLLLSFKLSINKVNGLTLLTRLLFGVLKSGRFIRVVGKDLLNSQRWRKFWCSPFTVGQEWVYTTEVGWLGLPSTISRVKGREGQRESVEGNGMQVESIGRETCPPRMGLFV